MNFKDLLNLRYYWELDEHSVFKHTRHIAYTDTFTHKHMHVNLFHTGTAMTVCQSPYVTQCPFLQHTIQLQEVQLADNLQQLALAGSAEAMLPWAALSQ